jgi:Protein of unknown function (DUF2815)
MEGMMPEAKENTAVLRTPLMRISYPALFVPRASTLVGEDGKPKPPQYSATLIDDNESKAHGKSQNIYSLRMTELFKAVGLMARERWPREFVADGAPYFDNQAWKSPWLDGGLAKYVTKSGLGVGTRFIRPSSNRIVPCVGRDGAPITSPDLIYPGCYVYALVAPFFYQNSKNHGVSFGLRGIQFVRDGERLDDAVDVSEYFPALEGDDIEVAGGNQEEALKNMFKV